MAEQSPSIGRVVHFVYGERHCAAIITNPDYEGEQALVVFPPNQDSFTVVARMDASCAPGTWHWPEYVPAK